MTFQRELAMRQIDLVHRSSIAHQFAQYALSLNYGRLPEDVVHQAKRCLLDGLGCAIGGYDSPGRVICEEAVKELGGPEEATVIGSGLRTSASNATLVNCYQLRFLDYNDMGGGGHNSDSIPAILAVGERMKSSGRDVLTSLVISYELGARVEDAVTEFEGWVREVRAGLNTPPAIGVLMGLDEEQIANAIGSCACGNMTLGAIDSLDVDLPMRKNLRFGWVAYAAILACALAKKGFTGPVRIVEADDGIAQNIFHGKMDFERMVNFSGWRILNTRHKHLCANSGRIGLTQATLELVREHDLKPEDIASVHIKVRSAEAARPILTQKYPMNAETADHSSFYLTAVAIKERAVGPDSVRPELFSDPVILDLIEKTTVESDPTIPQQGYGAKAGKSKIVTKDGRVLENYVFTPHGFGDDPLTDKELEEKFREMAAKYMDEKQIQKLFDAIWNVEKLDNINSLMKLMVFPR